ncbi:MAG: cytochrome C assembly protein [Chloroflexi bacterium]|nr:cytochrome C assembly protein [Chloroflexota bacterium]
MRQAQTTELPRPRRLAALREPANAVLYAALLLSMGLALFMAFVFAPAERVQAEIYRLLFVHVPSAWLAFAAFGVVAVGSVMFLVRGKSRWDRLAHASAEIGVLFTTLCLVTGSIWGRSVWGVWWQWDPRLTTTLIMWFIYVSYLALRSYIDDPNARQRMSSVVGIVGVVSVPIVWFSVEWWRSLHPTPSVTNPGGGMPPEMLTTLLVSVAAFTVFYVVLLRQRMQLELAVAELGSLRERLYERNEESA